MSGMDRARHNRRRRKGGPPPRPARRTPPPSRTGLEARFFESLERGSKALVVVLTDGRKIAGSVQGVDHDLLTLAADSGEVVIRKDEIRYLYEATEES